MGAKTYTDLIRDRRDGPSRNTRTCDAKLERAKRSEEMENRHEGEGLEPLDPASLPTDPTRA